VRRPVWLLSLDTEQFAAVPMTTGALKAYFAKHGATAPHTDVELVHFFRAEDIDTWLRDTWDAREVHRARQAVATGVGPVVGLSFYTWNAAEFLAAAERMRSSCPGLLVVAGGPHVQRAEDYLHDEGIDVVVLGEGEQAFQELLDCPSRERWAGVEGVAYLDDTRRIHKTPARTRTAVLDSLPSALDVIELRDPSGVPRYTRVAYETSRGCPFRCSFCEWGTGAIGTKMRQFGLERIRSDFERLIEGGVQDIWLCDSNFGALREDLDKARLIVDLRHRTGRPSTFQTSWSKNHSSRVQEIVKLLHREGLLHHYNLALQTLTPLALQLSNRKNMRFNQYEPIARSMSAEGVPIATELIWGLPGDNLPDFEASLDRLSAVFPNINIFGYTLLPGTEFFDRREEYRIQTLPVAGYGKARGEYVIGSHTFDREQGMEGYFLITAHIVLVRGYVMPLTARQLAFEGTVSVSALLRAVLRDLVELHGSELEGLDARDRMGVYERRAELYLAMLRAPERTFEAIRAAVDGSLRDAGAGDAERARARATLDLDEAFCPRVGARRTLERTFPFAAEGVLHHLSRMERPPDGAFASGTGGTLRIAHPGHVGEVLKDPDGGSWMRGQVVAEPSSVASSAL
jgi:hypothetical protein